MHEKNDPSAAAREAIALGRLEAPVPELAQAGDSDRSPWIDLGSATVLSASRMSRHVVTGVDVLLCWSEGVPFAYRNRCTHLEKPLDGGRLIAGQIQCPFHGASFDVRSGAALCGPAVAPLQRVFVKVDAGRLLIQAAATGPAIQPQPDPPL